MCGTDEHNHLRAVEKWAVQLEGENFSEEMITDGNGVLQRRQNIACFDDLEECFIKQLELTVN